MTQPMVLRSAMQFRVTKHTVEKKIHLKPFSRVAPSMRDSQTDTVTIEVRDTRDAVRRFVIHKSVLCFHSEFSGRAFNGPFLEGVTQQMTFNTISEKAFGIFIDWIYRQHLRNTEGELPGVDELIDLYIMADSIDATKVQNEALVALNEVTGKSDVLPSHLFHRVYENTTASSPLRHFFVEKCVHALADNIDLTHLPLDMMGDIILGWAGTHARKPARLTKEKMSALMLDEMPKKANRLRLKITT